MDAAIFVRHAIGSVIGLDLGHCYVVSNQRPYSRRRASFGVHMVDVGGRRNYTFYCRGLEQVQDASNVCIF